jgi:hypothetical protein
MTDALNLNDPQMIQNLLSVSVTDTPPGFQNDEQVEQAKVTEKLRPAEQLKAKVDKAKQSATFTYKLDGAQLQQIQRHALEAGFTPSEWQSYLRSEIESKIFAGPVASPRITKPSWATGKVTSPNGW